MVTIIEGNLINKDAQVEFRAGRYK